MALTAGPTLVILGYGDNRASLLFLGASDVLSCIQPNVVEVTVDESPRSVGMPTCGGGGHHSSSCLLGPGLVAGAGEKPGVSTSLRQGLELVGVCCLM